MFSSFAAIINAWPTDRPNYQAAAYAAEIGTTSLNTRAWRHADSIPCGWWKATVEAAGRVGLAGVTYELLGELAHQKRLARGEAPRPQTREDDAA